MENAVILNSERKPVILNAQEQRVADVLQRQMNSLGYEVNITTLTKISKLISEQSFFEIAPADFIPVRVGNGAWSSNILTYRSFDLSDEFEKGVLNLGGQSARLATADAGVDSVTIQVFNWAKEIGWTIMELQQAAKAGNWDVVTAKEKSRKKNWDLGIQRIAFLGANGQNGSGGNCLGLLNQSSVNINTALITQPISAMDTTALKTFTAQLINTFRSNCQRTAWPTHFAIPESDYLGLASMASPQFPIKSVLELLEDAFKANTRNPNFKILPLAYGDAAYHSDVASIAGKQCYALYKSEEETIRQDIPVDYTNTVANSINNFQFQNAAFGQFTGVGVYKPLEVLYFQY